MRACHAILLAALVSATSLQASSGRWIRFDASPGNKVTLRGTYSIHEWRAEGGLVGGFLEVESHFLSAQTNAPQLKRIEARGEAFIPVRNLKAMGHTWEPDNEQITVAMHRMLKAETNPKILFRLREPLVPIAPRSGGAMHVYEATGDLVIAGATNRVTMPIEIARLAATKLKVSGSIKLKQSEFGVVPKPQRVLGSWDNDTVAIAFEWLVKNRPGHEAPYGSPSK